MADAREPRRASTGAIAYGLLGLPVHLVTLTITAYGWAIVAMNSVLYPFRAGSLEDSWGGPTLAGAWTFHLVARALPALFLMPWIVRGLTALQGVLAKHLLGPR